MEGPPRIRRRRRRIVPGLPSIVSLELFDDDRLESPIGDYVHNLLVGTRLATANGSSWPWPQEPGRTDYITKEDNT